MLGATAGPLDLAGGLIPIQNWYAPSLYDNREAGVGDWPESEVVALLKDGVSARGSVQGPMAEVVARSTQHLSDDDLACDGELPGRLAAGPADATARTGTAPPTPRRAHAAPSSTRRIARRATASKGEGVAGAYPALAGNRAVTIMPPANLVHIVLHGGFPPTTAGNPRPFGMPPFATVLSDAGRRRGALVPCAHRGATAGGGVDARGEPLPRRCAALSERALAQNGYINQLSVNNCPM